MLPEELNCILKVKTMIGITSDGDFKNVEQFLRSMKEEQYLNALEKYAKIGVTALQQATPKDTGETANSWSYEIHRSRGRAIIYWTNSKENKGERIAILLQYGHGTRNGGYVIGRDYINPAMRPVFDQLAEDVWGEVTSA